MTTLDGGPRRVSYATPARKTTDSSSPSFDYNDRKASLKEKPSFRDEASSALHRKDDLTKMGDRLKEGKDLLNEDLASKPWLKYIAQRKISRKESAERSLGEDASPTIEAGKINVKFNYQQILIIIQIFHNCQTIILLFFLPFRFSKWNIHCYSGHGIRIRF